MARCPVIPDPHYCPAGRKTTPHTLIWSESAEQGKCPVDLVHGCVSGEERMWWWWWGGLETKLNAQEKQKVSYCLGNFNNIVCEKIFKGNYIIIEKHRFTSTVS